MAAYEPALYNSPGVCNTPGEQTFKLEVTYGSSAPASAWGAYLAVRDTAQGKITVCFPKTYRKLTGFRWGWKSIAAGAVYFPVILTNSIATADATSGGGTLVIETRAEAGTATDPASGDVLCLEFDVSNDVRVDDFAIVIT
jgi:hypothetical protein